MPSLSSNRKFAGSVSDFLSFPANFPPPVMSKSRQLVSRVDLGGFRLCFLSFSFPAVIIVSIPAIPAIPLIPPIPWELATVLLETPFGVVQHLSPRQSGNFVGSHSPVRFVELDDHRGGRTARCFALLRRGGQHWESSGTATGSVGSLHASLFSRTFFLPTLSRKIGSRNAIARITDHDPHPIAIVLARLHGEIEETEEHVLGRLDFLPGKLRRPWAWTRGPWAWTRGPWAWTRGPWAWTRRPWAWDPRPMMGIDPRPMGIDPLPMGMDPLPMGMDPLPMGMDPLPMGMDPLPIDIGGPLPIPPREPLLRSIIGLGPMPGVAAACRLQAPGSGSLRRRWVRQADPPLESPSVWDACGAAVSALSSRPQASRPLLASGAFLFFT